MKITMIGRKVNLRDHFKALVRKKLSRFDRIFDEDAEAKVVVTLAKNRQTVEITIRSRGVYYRAESTAAEMNTALDEVVAALSSQIRRNKKKLSHKLHSAALEEDIREFPAEGPASAEEYRVVRVKHFPVKPMSVEEAVLQMNLLDHQFFMFRNQEDSQINVVYKRRDGNYGLLTPDAD